MKRQVSAGILLYRRRPHGIEVFLVHPGGPYWKRKDEGAWSIPKGESEQGDDLLEVARREFFEETGAETDGPFQPLSPVKQPGGKLVHAWAVEGNLDPAALTSNTFTIEWPPRSGRRQEFPEVDRGGWFTCSAARAKLLKGQQPLLDELEQLVEGSAE